MKKVIACVGRKIGGAALAIATLAPLAIAAPPVAKSYIVYVAGGYSRDLGKGIYGYRLTPSTGDLEPLGLIQEAVRPSWLTAHPNHRVVYATRDSARANASGIGYGVAAYARDMATGKLTVLNTVKAGGVAPAQLAIDGAGKVLVAANFGNLDGGVTVASFPISPDGKLGEAVSVFEQKGVSDGPNVPRDANGLSPTDSHNHCVMMAPDSRFAFVCNLGLGKVFSFRVNAQTGALQQNGAPFAMPGGATARPHHLAFNPNGKYAYILDGEMRVVTAAYDAAAGSLKAIQTIPILPDKTASATFAGSEIVVSPAGKFVYTSARAVDATLKSLREDGSINVFAVNSATGKLTPIQQISSGGIAPRVIALDPTGGYLFVGNQISDAVTIFAVDAGTGKLTPTGKNLKESPEPGGFLFEAEK